MTGPSDPRTYIVIVNWNGWRDTIECLESVLRLDHNNFAVIVCDNDSKDESVERIIEWANGDRLASSGSAEMGSFTSPAVPKPIPFILLQNFKINEPQVRSGRERLVLIKSQKNLGFAGGNNLGLRYVLDRDDHEYIWILNNDTVVHPKALTELISRMKEDLSIGICGSKLCFYSTPNLVQAYGGATYNPITARNRHIGALKKASEREDRAKIERQIEYIIGASMLVSKRFLNSVGLMNEEYFLYFDEIDWATRAQGKFSQGYAPTSIVFHKQGESMGGKWLTRWSEPEENFILSDFYGVRNQIRFTRRYYPQYLPFVTVNIAWRLLKRIIAGKKKRVRSVMQGVSSAFSGKLLDPASLQRTK